MKTPSLPRGFVSCFSLFAHVILCAPTGPTVIDGAVSYVGTSQADVESFQNIRYGKDTGGINRFKQPRQYSYPPGTNVDATSIGFACPQKTGNPTPSLIGIFGNVSAISEDCLTIRVDRPMDTKADARLPVMVYLYGGGYNIGQAYDTSYNPNGLLRGSAAKKLPIVYVAINYRIGLFGFNASPALRKEGNLNVGLLDQYLGLQWVQDHIAAFGGNNEDVTVFGEDTGWANVALQLTAYGGKAKHLFDKAILQSGPTTGGDGLTSGITEQHVTELSARVNCTAGNSAAQLKCLRALPLQELTDAAVAYAFEFDALAGVGTFKPTAPSPFTPEAPSKLFKSGQFQKNVNIIIGWNEDDGTQFVLPQIVNSTATFTAWAAYKFPKLSAANSKELANLYPESDFTDFPAENVEKNYFRAARIIRDIDFTCPSLLLADAYSAQNDVYLWTLNFTVFRVGHALFNRSFEGQDHFSDIPYVFDYVNQVPYSQVADQTDYNLASLMSGSWAAFANYAQPTIPGVSAEQALARNLTLAPWSRAQESRNGDRMIRIIGGPKDGLATIPAKDGSRCRGRQLYDEKLATRCGFWNRQDVLEQTFN